MCSWGQAEFRLRNESSAGRALLGEECAARDICPSTPPLPDSSPCSSPGWTPHRLSSSLLPGMLLPAKAFLVLTFCPLWEAWSAGDSWPNLTHLLHHAQEMLLVSPAGGMVLFGVGMVGGWRGCISP